MQQLDRLRFTLRQLEVLIAVADSGSTAAAGERVALSQSATSAALGELESLLGAQLFDRVGRRLLLNDRGRAVLPQVRAALDDLRRVEAGFGATPGAGGEAPLDLRLAASRTIGTYLVPPMLAALLGRQPQARVTLRIANTRAVAAAVARLEVDVGLVEGHCSEPDLVVERWAEDRLVLVCAAADPLASRAVGDAELRGARWLLREPGSGTREAVEQALLPRLDYFVQTLEFDSNEALLQGVAAGLGIACLSVQVAADLLALGRVRLVATELPPIVRPLFLVHHRARVPSPALRAALLAPAAGP
ncbi:LysR family transcriptional regulator [Rubrivivax gelatinosus]|uniref:LysR substrate-binding domain-containing protein n=1 Tax=Rubrivivax gelatinosus TaxID=28068 RepID=UPI0019067055|nr:LysR substrate-binding domain-containing protein [Rubrivivax gelatinosus]MBK1613646.1 LysR family transcriptional regulator [Rubrivivax gelatinosus]